MTPVYVTRIRPGDLVQSLRRVFEREWVGRRVRAAKRVAIKINLCDYRRAESGATTDPAVLAGLLHVLNAYAPSARISVIENDATSVQADSLFRLLGISAVAEEHGVDVVNVADGEWVRTSVPNALALPEVDVPRVVADADLFINFAKLKTNSFTRMTGCLKNTFGLMRPKRKVPYHANLAKVLTDLSKAMPPDLCLIDGMIAMEGLGGPAFGQPKRAELFLAGRDPVATDACAARVIGFSPWLVGHIRTAHRAGLGTIRYTLETDETAFRYRDHRLQFSNLQYMLRAVIRGRVGLGV